MPDVVCQASDACRAQMRAGVPAFVPHEAAKRVISDAGTGSHHGRVHLSGYWLSPGSPPGWAEPIHLYGGSPYILQSGMVLTIELSGRFLGEEALECVIIDNVVITDDAHGVAFSLSSRFDRV